MIELYHGPCQDLTPILSDVHVSITDPPYSEHVHASARTNNFAGVGSGAKQRDLGFAAISAPLRAWIAGAVAKVRRWSLIYSDIDSAHLWREACESAGAKSIRSIPWIRWSQPQLSGDRPSQACEMLTLYWGSQKGKKSWNGPGSLMALEHESEDEDDLVEVSHLRHKCLRGKHKHPTEKPLDQMLDLVSWFSNSGELVADFTAGNATTGLACRLLGREFIGAELNDTWATEGALRLEGPLSARDAERAQRFIQATTDEAKRVPAPRSKAEEKTYERAQRRIDDALRVAKGLL